MKRSNLQKRNVQLFIDCRFIDLYINFAGKSYLPSLFNNLFFLM